MNNNGRNWATIIFSAIIGILLIRWHDEVQLLNWVVVAVGVMLMVPGLWSLVAALTSKGVDRKTRIASSTAAVVCVGFGVWMVVYPAFFVALVAYVFAALLILYGVYQIIVTGYLAKSATIPFYFYIVPVAMILAGTITLFTSVREMNSVVVFISGIALLLSSINYLIEVLISDYR